MPVPIITVLLEALLVITAAVALAYWEKICAWFADHANPWLKKNVHRLQPHILKAFQFLDSEVATPVRRAVIKAWQKVRPYLLKAVVQFEQNARGNWVRRITSYLRAKLSEDASVTKRVEEVEMDWSELPEEVRERILETKKARKIDYVKLRDQELEMEVTA